MRIISTTLAAWWRMSVPAGDGGYRGPLRTLRFMITLSPTLLAHQRGRARRPALRLLAEARRGGHEILTWTQHHAGAEPDVPHAAAIAADGALLRARNASGTLYVERVAAPEPGSTFGSWSSLGSCTSGTGVALAVGDGEVLLAYVASGAVQLRTSTDGGASWSSAAALVTAAATSVALAIAPGGGACLFYSTGTSVARLRRTSGSWAGSGTAWSNSAATVTGLAAVHFAGDYHLVVTGTEQTTGDPRAWGTLMGDGNLPANLWAGLGTIAGGDSGSGVTFAGPHLAVLGGRLRAGFSRIESGDVASARVHLATPAATQGANGDWSESAPTAISGEHGLALAIAGERAWGCTAAEVWSAPRPGPPISLDNRLVAVTARVGPGGASCRLELRLDEDGLTPFPGLVAGGAVELAPGYISGDGGAAEYGATLGFIVTRVTRRVADGRHTAVVEGHSIAEELSRFRAPQVWLVTGGSASLATIHGRLVARAGFASASSSTSSNWTGVQAAFVLAAGETAASGVARLLAPVSDAPRYDSARLVTIAGLDPEETAVESYGGDGHPLAAIETVDGEQTVTAVRLQGPDRYADAVDADAVARHGLRQATVRHLEASSDARAAGWAAAALARYRLDQARLHLTAPVHAGLQLYDVVTLTAPALGLDDERYRVTGLALHYEHRDGRPPRYDQEITLGEP